MTGDVEPEMQDDLIKLARVDFATFFELAFPVLHNGNPVVWAQYLDLLTHVLLGAADRRCRRLMLNLPPGHMKSMLVSIMYVAWRLGRDPTAKFICISYGDDLAHYLSSRTRDLMLSAVYRNIFPGTVLKNKAQDFLTTTKGGYRYATAVSSDITGFRADEIIIDDPLQPADATSGLEKDKVNKWIQDSVLSRFKHPSEGVMIMVGHRVAPDDPFGILEQTGNWKVFKLPLVAESREIFIRASDKSLLMFRKPGDILNPNWMTDEDVERLKSEIAPHVYASQYQQRPLHGSSGMCSIDRIKRYSVAPPFELKIHSWDIAITAGGNYTVCTKWGVAKLPKLGDVLFLLDLVRIQVESPDVREAIMMHDLIDKPDLIIVDSGGAGLPILQDLQTRGYRHAFSAGDIPENQQSKGKITRFSKAMLYVYDGKVLFPESAPFLDALFAELAAFPNGKYDDQVDSISQLVANLENALMFARHKHRPDSGVYWLKPFR